MKLAYMLVVVSVWLSACSSYSVPTALDGLGVVTSIEEQKRTTLYDVSIYEGRSKKSLSVEQLAKALKNTDVIFIGEYHGNHGSHWLQAQLQSALHVLNPRQVLSMEQFSRHSQASLDQYLKGKTGEVVFIKNADAWPNYKASYRPLVEFAKVNELPVIAANAPANIVRCIGREGKAYLSRLNDAQRKHLAERVFLNDKEYQAAFQKVMHAPSEKNTGLSNSYLAQLSRDNTIAESIIDALDEHLGSQLVHINGAFHSDFGLGTVALLKKRRPALKIAVISPLRDGESQDSEGGRLKGDFIYRLSAQPKQYVGDAERKAAYKAMFKQARSRSCL